MSDDLRVHDDVATLVGDAASWFLARLEAAQGAGRDPHVALTGGSISTEFHAEVLRRAPDSSVDWERVTWWWGDDRFLPVGDAERNADQARASLLDDLGVPADRVHEVPAAVPGRTVADAALAYEQTLRREGAGEFEVVLLGLGPDGHVASLFPGHASLGTDDRIAIAETDSPKPPRERVSLTFAALNRARTVAFLLAGEGKAEALAAARAPGRIEDCPARGVRGQEETVWFVDRAAASGLPRSPGEVPDGDLSG
jgi:6-phosphogluconolactonase